MTTTIPLASALRCHQQHLPTQTKLDLDLNLNTCPPHATLWSACVWTWTWLKFVGVYVSGVCVWVLSYACVAMGASRAPYVHPLDCIARRSRRLLFFVAVAACGWRLWCVLSNRPADDVSLSDGFACFVAPPSTGCDSDLWQQHVTFDHLLVGW